MPRVKTVWDDGRRQHVDVGRQFVVEPPDEGRAGNVRADIEMRDLRQGVDACIGTARSVQLEITPSRDRTDRPVDLALDRPRVLLNLPAAVPRAGVLDVSLKRGTPSL